MSVQGSGPFPDTAVEKNKFVSARQISFLITWDRDRISLQNDVLGRWCQETGSELEIFQVIVPKQESSGMWRAYYKGMGHPITERTLSALQQCCY